MHTHLSRIEGEVELLGARWHAVSMGSGGIDWRAGAHCEVFGERVVDMNVLSVVIVAIEVPETSPAN